MHCYPDRHPRGELGLPAVVRIIQYACAAATCGATWRTLPMFLARHLWRVWATVERVHNEAVDDRRRRLAFAGVTRAWVYPLQ